MEREGILTADEKFYVVVDLPSEADRNFNRTWQLIDPRKIRIDDEDEERIDPAALDEGKFYIFKIKWVIGEKALEEQKAEEVRGKVESRQDEMGEIRARLAAKQLVVHARG